MWILQILYICSAERMADSQPGHDHRDHDQASDANFVDTRAELATCVSGKHADA